jgi:hypothetical protein
MNLDKLCEDIAQAIRDSYTNAGAHSGISKRGEEDIAAKLKALVAAVIEELKEVK